MDYDYEHDYEHDGLGQGKRLFLVSGETGGTILRMTLAWIKKIDEDILSFLRRLAQGRIVGPMLRFLSHPPYWRQSVSVLALLMSVWFVVGPSPIRWRIACLFVTILVSDQTCNLLKALVKRVRPDGRRGAQGTWWGRLGVYSFPSSHAANTFAASVLFSAWLPPLAALFNLAAAMIALSRICLNNHYPSDVLIGAGIGLGYSFLALTILTRVT